MTENESRITTDDLTDEQIEQVLNSRGFQKMLAYQKLADGIEVLEEQDELFDSMVNSIQKQHGSISTESSIQECLRLFRQEVQTFTEPIAADGESEHSADDLEEVFVDES
jgi:hypothetical protein